MILPASFDKSYSTSAPLRSVSSQQVVQLLEWLFLLSGATSYQRSDNGLKFIDFALQHCFASGTAKHST